MDINLIVAIDSNCSGIGKDGKIPWHNKEDMKFFKDITTGNGNNAVIMGRTTYESIGKPLPNRLNIVLSKTLNNNIQDINVLSSLEDAIKFAEEQKIENTFIIGGASVYKEALNKNLINGHIFITYIKTDLTKFDYDTFFDFYECKYSASLNAIYTTIIRKKYNNLAVSVYNVIKGFNLTDNQYLKLLYKVLSKGETKHTRAGETLSLFNESLEFDLRLGLPILTTKKVYAKGCIHELLWFLKGGTNIKYLIDNNTHIWDDDAYRFYLENAKHQKGILSKEKFLEAVKEEKIFAFKTEKEGILSYYKAGDLGPVYGKQWTNWNGVNQIDELIDKLKNNPDDRRLMISAWNVGELKDMALPPCHYLSQWYTNDIPHDERVELLEEKLNTSYRILPNSITEERLDEENIPKKYLSCMWQQRSVDVCLGLPYDILSYSLLLSMIAQVCNMVPYRLIANLGDTHVYKNQIESAYKQLERNPFKYASPILTLNKDITNIYDFKYEDINIEKYDSYPTIKYQLSVGL